MSLIKNILARIWAIWGLISFAGSFILILIPSMCAYLFREEKKGQDFFNLVSRIWMNTWLFLIACPVKVNGKENFKDAENYIIVFNHNTLLDVPLSSPFIYGGNKTIAKDSFAKIPLFGWFYKRGSILVNRKDEKSRIRSFEEMKRVLAKGIHMCIYPEGTRNRTAAPLKPFYDGAFKLSVDTKKPIMPCLIIGTREAMPVQKTLFLWPTTLKMYFLPPILPGNQTAKELKENIYKVMEAEYIKQSSKK